MSLYYLHCVLLSFISLILSALCDDHVITFGVNEKESSNAIIGDLATEGRLRDRFPGEFASFKYALMADENINYFKLFPPETSILRVNKEISITELCEKNRLCCPRKKNYSDCKLTVYVNANLGSVTKVSLRVEVTIKDINDNGCHFSEKNYTVSFLENQDSGESSIPAPYDPDVKYPVKQSRIRLDPAEGHPFSLKIEELFTTRPPFRVSLIHNGGLDRERTPKYSLRAIADDGEPSHACSMALNIIVRDANDNYPIFEKKVYSLNVSESIGRKNGRTFVRSHLLTVKAIDKDIGRNARIRYSIGTDEADIGLIFNVNATNGNLYLLRRLDYKVESSYTFPIVATDSASLNPNTGTTTVSITVIDENDNAPKIILRNKDGGKDITVPEGVDAKRISVATILVTDADTGNNGRFDCTMEEDNNTKLSRSRKSKPSFAFKQLGSRNSYQVIAEGTFDREVTPVVYFTIVCTDYGSPKLWNRTRVSVRVRDINDHRPVFQNSHSSMLGGQNVYEFRVIEHHSLQPDNLKGEIGRVIATDDDEGENAKVRYKINPTSASPHAETEAKKLLDVIQIDPFSGQITSGTELDRELVKRFQFEVVAYDGGTPSLSATATVSVIVEDYNDNKPQFKNNIKEIKLHVRENSPPGTDVGSVTATDGDDGENSKIIFSIDDGRMHQAPPFQVTTEHGPSRGSYIAKVRTTKVIDRESNFFSGDSRPINPVLYITLRAEDNGVPRLTATVELAISILDVNDETPTFSFPINNASIKVSYLEPADFQIMKVETRDNDAGENGTVCYQIINGNHMSYFAIDENKGALRLATNMPKTAIGEYALTIEARDKGSPSRASTTLVFVSIVDGIPLNLKRLQGGRTAITNLYIIVAIVVGSAVISVVLLTAICIVIRRSRRDTRDAKHADYPLCPNGDRRESYDISYPSAGYSTGRREVTFSPTTMDTGSFRLQYHDLTAETKRGSLASNNDKDSGNGDSLDVNSGAGHRFVNSHNHLEPRSLGASPYTACVTPVMRTFGSTTNTSSGIGGSNLGSLEPYTPLSFETRSNMVMLDDNRRTKKFTIASTAGTLPRRKQSPEASFV